MGRKSSKTIEEKIQDQEALIKQLEENLVTEKDNLKNLQQQKEEKDMKEMYAYAKGNGITLEDIVKIMDKQKK